MIFLCFFGYFSAADMKKIKLILALGCCFSLYSVARAQTNMFKDTTGFITNLHFVETPPLSELMEAFKVEEIDDITKMTEAKDKVRKGSNPFVKSNPNSLSDSVIPNALS